MKFNEKTGIVLLFLGTYARTVSIENPDSWLHVVLVITAIAAFTIGVIMLFQNNKNESEAT